MGKLYYICGCGANHYDDYIKHEIIHICHKCGQPLNCIEIYPRSAKNMKIEDALYKCKNCSNYNKETKYCKVYEETGNDNNRCNHNFRLKILLNNVNI